MHDFPDKRNLRTIGRLEACSQKSDQVWDRQRPVKECAERAQENAIMQQQPVKEMSHVNMGLFTTIMTSQQVIPQITSQLMKSYLL
jgi:hypothetical protein